MPSLTPPPVTHPGLLIAIGGAEDKTRERLILRYFLEAAGGDDASIVVLATASETPETGERYADLFLALRAETVEVLKIETRDDALAAGAEAHDLLEYATGLFITGGSQLKLSSVLGGTEIAQTIRDRHAAGMVVAGTSAGAALLSEHMIALGDSGSTPRRRLVHLAKGLGLAPDLVIDQHFRRRDRLGRLLTALSYNPAPLGVGIDEDTAAIISGNGELSVLGSGAVMVVDASQMRFTDSHAVVRGQPVAMIGVKLDFLTTGCRYDLARRQGITPPPMLHLDPVDRRVPERPPVMSEKAMEELRAERAEDGGE
ncbi:MAG TPA: cyanophycinase [Thermoanaerobaculia bacterium]|jgi:cyanophycinase|nr:cyanophycinase [Thermoanaerobaculia bacterium]